MRPAALALALALLAPATASAAFRDSLTAPPFGELPFRPVAGGATCLRATGAPGELVRLGPTGARFLSAGAGGFTFGAEVRAGGTLTDCPVAAAQPNGAGALAIVRPDAGGETMLMASLREPGGV